MNLSTRVYVARRRAANRWYDLLAVLHSYCNDRSRKTGLPGQGDGYVHWRCALRRGHGGLHRSRNYVWDNWGAAEYAPVDDMPNQPWERHMVRTRRQERLLRRWDEEQYRQILARLAAEKETDPR